MTKLDAINALINYKKQSNYCSTAQLYYYTENTHQYMMSRNNFIPDKSPYQENTQYQLIFELYSTMT